MAQLPIGYRHAGYLQLSLRRPRDTCGLRTRQRTDVDPPRFLPAPNCHRRGHIVSPPPGRYLVFSLSRCVLSAVNRRMCRGCRVRCSRVWRGGARGSPRTDRCAGACSTTASAPRSRSPSRSRASSCRSACGAKSRRSSSSRTDRRASSTSTFSSPSENVRSCSLSLRAYFCRIRVDTVT